MIFSFLFLAAIVVWVDMLMGEDGKTKMQRSKKQSPQKRSAVNHPRHLLIGKAFPPLRYIYTSRCRLAIPFLSLMVKGGLRKDRSGVRRGVRHEERRGRSGASFRVETDAALMGFRIVQG